MDKVIEKCEMFCTGCGLCSSQNKVEFKTDSKGFMKPVIEEKDLEFCKGICPAMGGLPVEKTVWGTYKQVCYGWASNGKIRTAASSGGSLTGICLYLLESKQVDGIIQTTVDYAHPYATRTVISRTEADVVSCLGSRYSISAPLSQMFEMMKPGEKYAFVGKPCDASAMRAYLDKRPELKDSIVIVLSFFCAGMPSIDAQKRLLNKLKVSEDMCESLQYRGNGWPGFTTAKDTFGREYKMTYEESWGKILGRDVRTCCRFCFDGIGLSADITCADAWYLKENNSPDFGEKEGRNIIFARTTVGNNILDDCFKNNILVKEDAKLSDLKYMQKYQYERRSTMLAQIIGLRLAGKPTPCYSMKEMLSLSKNVSIKKQLGRIKGIFLRCRNGTIQ